MFRPGAKDTAVLTSPIFDILEHKRSRTIISSSFLFVEWQACIDVCCANRVSDSVWKIKRAANESSTDQTGTSQGYVR
jgi:hypothetical protein